MKNIKIGNKIVGENQPVFFIAELSGNHNQNFDLAIKTIKAAKDVGADAIKLQTFKPEILTLDCDNEYFHINQGTLWDGTTFYSLYQQVYTPWEWQPKLKEYAESQGLICFSSPFDNTAVDFLEKIDVPAYKVASFEILDIHLIEYIASKGKPVIISTGIADLTEIEDALNVCKKVSNDQVVLLKCTSAYPAPIEEANLQTIPDMANRFNTIVGLSDHTLGDIAAITSVALGAKIIEKHFILDRKYGGPDAEFSMEPAEFKKMVESIRDVEKAIGSVQYEITKKIQDSRKFARSLFVVEKMSKGDIFTNSNVRSIRPGNGMMPKYLFDILGKKASCNIEIGTPLTFELIETK